LTIERNILEIDYENGIIKVFAKCTHYKEPEKVEKEIVRLGLTLRESVKVGSITRIPGEFKVPSKDHIEDLDKKLEELNDAGWNIRTGTIKH
jgi:predicted DNA-binding antitoxin AbrB/MazE fold protein